MIQRHGHQQVRASERGYPGSDPINYAMAKNKLEDKMTRWPGVCDFFRNYVQSSLDLLDSGQGLPDQIIPGLAAPAERFALECFFIKDDLDEAKNWFYVSALASTVGIERYGRDLMRFSTPLNFAMLSDCKALQERLARLTYPAREARLVKRDFDLSVRLQQRLLLDDYHGAQADYEALLPSLVKKAYGRFGPDMLVFEGLINRDMERLETGMAQLLEKSMVRYRNKDSIPGIGEWLSHPAMWYAKLAWIKGMEIQIDHPMVPMALLPVSPLPEYKSPWSCLS